MAHYTDLSNQKCFSDKNVKSNTETIQNITKQSSTFTWQSIRLEFSSECLLEL